MVKWGTDSSSYYRYGEEYGIGYVAIDSVLMETPRGRIPFYFGYRDTTPRLSQPFVFIFTYGDTLDRGSYSLWAMGRASNGGYYYSDTARATW